MFRDAPTPERNAEINSVLLSQWSDRRRTSLNVEYGSGEIFITSAMVAFNQSQKLFNSVGSLALPPTVVNTPAQHRRLHLPVLNVDGGAEVDERNKGRTAVLKFLDLPGSGEKYVDNYRPSSFLLTVFGDYDIDLTVFPQPAVGDQRVGGLVLRAKKEGTFKVFDSTQEGHSHLYIQQPFEDGDHQLLIEELTRAGILSETWQSIVEKEGMGVVRAPWTKKELTEKIS